MGFIRSRIRKVLQGAEEYKVTLSCRRCGYQVEVPEDVPMMLFAVAFPSRDSDHEARLRHYNAILEETLGHPCVEGAESKGWAFVEGSPSTNDGHLAALAYALTRSLEEYGGEDLSEPTNFTEEPPGALREVPRDP